MASSALDGVLDNLTVLVRQKESFQTCYDQEAGDFLEGLPGLFRLFHWLTFDLEVAPEQRRKAASIAIYIAEPHDYCGEFNRGVEGLIDDLWLAYTGLNHLAKVVPIELLQRHWRSEASLFRLLDLSRTVATLESHLPSRVLEKLKAFIEP
jgi:hypothetical protein